MNTVLWVMQGLLALSCIFSGSSKALGPVATVKRFFPWVNHVPIALVRFIGVCELAGGIGLLLPGALGIFPWLTVAAAVGIMLLMLCAALFHAGRREFLAIGPAIILFVLAVFIVIGRWTWV